MDDGDDLGGLDEEQQESHCPDATRVVEQKQCSLPDGWEHSMESVAARRDSSAIPILRLSGHSTRSQCHPKLRRFSSPSLYVLPMGSSRRLDMTSTASPLPQCIT